MKITQYKDRSHCPCCKPVIKEGELLEDRLTNKHYTINDNSNLKLPEETH